MNRKRKDQLMSLAFGDLKNEDIHQVSSEESRQLESYRALREDLKMLNNIPAHQLSNERLRDAVLGQGLKPVSAKPSIFGWLWMPTAACLLAFAIVTLRPKTAAEPKLMINPPATEHVMAFNSGLDKPNTRPAPVATIDHASPTTPVAAEKPATKKHRVRSIDNASAFAETTGIDWSSALASMTTATESAPVSSTTQVASDASSSANNIVLIDQDKNVETTTPRATEIGSPSNVLVGG